jgi:mRNA-degrading endonuclease toxin of MazEF toxin-antitoxin module
VINAGDIHLAHLSDEVRRRVLVLSNARFNEMSGRVLVAPEVPSDPDEVLFPWRVRVDDTVYAIDLGRTLRADRILDRVDRAPFEAIASARRALQQIT